VLPQIDTRFLNYFVHCLLKPAGTVVIGVSVLIETPNLALGFLQCLSSL
jgi:hypothetical protein